MIRLLNKGIDLGSAVESSETQASPGAWLSSSASKSTIRSILKGSQVGGKFKGTKPSINRGFYFEDDVSLPNFTFLGQ